ncbi:heterokaryon incompatibility protein-domain-containing protein [Aspergillus cavernicola]|uniref:Heterokaryon incompatibility protein-domain-containing protein n=1 Tax=Aspergillus cavernicola TaxID=176166 RepID=A0ABR4I0Z3_9EURO
MDHISASFTYSSLNPDRVEIRLLTIAPDKNESPVRCTLQTVSLNRPPQFEALSYVWGTVVEKVEISVDNIPFQVTTNLEAALKCLRHSRKKRLIWIDYVCIDQGNVKEKNTQLPLMGRIYRDATSVIAWLGPLTPNMEQTMSMINRRKSGLAGILQDVRQMKPSWGQKSRRGSILSFCDAVEGFLEIASAPYWGRIWTFQEYYLPEKLPVGMCGNLPFTVPSLFELCMRFSDVLSAYIKDLDKIAPRQGDAADIENHRKLQSRVKESLHRLAQSNPMSDFAHDIVSERRRPSSFVDALELTAQRQCYDPLDRFYALYSLVAGVEKKYPVNYDSEADEVAMQITLWILVYEGADFVFNMFHFYDGPHGNILGSPSPSWVPNYRDTTSRSKFGYKQLDQSLQDFEQRDYMTNLSLAPFKYILHFWARPVGRTQIITIFPKETVEIGRELWHLLRKPASTWGNGIDQENMAERLIGAFLANTGLPQAFSIEDYLKALEQLVNPSSDELSDSIKMSSWGKQLLRDLPSLAGRTVFQLIDSPMGGFGIGVGNLQDGDLLILSGKMTNPIALRDSGYWNPIDEDVVHYRMIGNVFVEGIAEDQKELPTPLLAEIKGRQFEDFHVV